MNARLQRHLGTWWNSEPICVGGIVSTRDEYRQRLENECGLSSLHAGSVAAAPYTTWHPFRFLLTQFKRRGKPVTVTLLVDRVADRPATYTFTVEELRA